MTAKDILSIHSSHIKEYPSTKVNSDLPVLEVLPLLLDTNRRELTVMEEDNPLGIIDQTSMLEGLGRMIASRNDCSIITLECEPRSYSASVIAHAVEDTDAHLVDLFSVPGENGEIMVTLRVRQNDPTAAVRSLERYGYHVVDVHASSDSMQSMEIATERLLALQALMNV